MLPRPLARRLFYSKIFIKRNYARIAGLVLCFSLAIFLLGREAFAHPGPQILYISNKTINYRKIPGTRNFYEIPRFINLYIDNGFLSDLTYASTLGQYLSDSGIVLSAEDELYPDKEFILGVSTTARIVRVESQQYIVTEEIPFTNVEIEDPELELDKEIVTQKGEDGLLEKTYLKIYKDGVFAENRLISETTLKAPTQEIIKRGTKLVPKTIVIDGKTITYYKKLWAWTTSYDSSCYGCSGTTATGAILTYGIIAADPKVIPWHTKVYVPGYGYGQMEDTGGDLKKATRLGAIHVDLGFDDVKTGWWYSQYAWVYLLYEGE